MEVVEAEIDPTRAPAPPTHLDEFIHCTRSMFYAEAGELPLSDAVLSNFNRVAAHLSKHVDVFDLDVQRRDDGLWLYSPQTAPFTLCAAMNGDIIAISATVREFALAVCILSTSPPGTLEGFFNEFEETVQQTNSGL